MANQIEKEEEQINRLFDLLKLEKDNPGVKIVGLNVLIARAKAPMKKEHIAQVIQMIAEL